jgi:hypothetical protein
MGLPGTKILLHVIGKAINVAAERREIPYNYRELHQERFALAGDDMVKIGPRAKLLEHKTTALRFKMKPSLPKWGVYSVGGPYCEQMLRIPGVASLNPEKTKSEGIPSLKIESVRGRLLSPCTKMAADNDRNPTLGKGKALGKELTWAPPRFVFPSVCWFLTNFREYGDYRCMAALPTLYGGFGFPLPEEVQLSWISQDILGVIQLCWSHRKTPRARRIIRGLSRMSRPLLFDRGERLKDLDYKDSFRDAIVDILGQRLEDLEELFQVRYHTDHPRYWDRVKKMRSLGYIPSTSFRPELPSYWERSTQPEKGWATAPLSERMKQVRNFFREEKIPTLNKDDLLEALRADHKSLLPDVVFIPRKGEIRSFQFFPMGFPDGIIPYNASGTGNGLSMSLQTPTKDLIFYKGDDHVEVTK